MVKQRMEVNVYSQENARYEIPHSAKKPFRG